MPVNYRIYDKSEGKTKNDYFREMLIEVLARAVSLVKGRWQQVQDLDIPDNGLKPKFCNPTFS